MSKRDLTILVFLPVLVLASPAQELSRPYVVPDLLQKLQAGTELRHSIGPRSPPQLLPALSFRERILQETAALGPTIGTEVLLLRAGSLWSLDSGASLLKLYNLLRSISRMKGIEYYSASRRRMRTLFAESYAIDGPVKRQRVPDPLVEEIPPSATLYVFQQDLTFGSNTYRSEYLYDEQEGVLALRNENLTPMRYLGMTMVKPAQNLTWLVLIPYEGNLLFYGLACARAVSFFGLEKTKEDSFYNRLKAIYGWYAAEVGKIF